MDFIVELQFWIWHLVCCDAVEGLGSRDKSWEVTSVHKIMEQKLLNSELFWTSPLHE